MPSFRTDEVRVRVPATSANLGPGFDSAGLALTLYDDVVVRIVASGLSVEVEGEGADDVPRDETHLVVQSLRTAFDRLGGQPTGLAISCTNRIPHARGLGSSSAAICAAVVAAAALTGKPSYDLLGLADELEGHPDNVAACLHGGATFAWGSPVQVLRIEPHVDLAPVAFVPPTQSSTRAVRGMLPAQIPFADAAANAGRSALLTTALSTAPELLLAATEDLLHQQYRAPAMPESAALVGTLRADGIPATISGAGPTVLALTSRDAASQVAGRVPEGWRALALQVDRGGATTS